MKRLTTFAVALFATIVSIQAQPITETMNEKAVLQYGNMKTIYQIIKPITKTN